MTTTFPNPSTDKLDSTDRTDHVNPSNVTHIVGEFARASSSDVDQAIASARTAFKNCRGRRPRSGSTCWIAPGTEILARKDEICTGCAREQGKPLADDGIGEAARAGYIFSFFPAKRCARRRRRSTDASGHRRRDHARAGRGRRDDHALELPAGDPGVEIAPASRRQLRRSSNPPAARRRRRGRWRTSSSGPASRLACSIW